MIKLMITLGCANLVLVVFGLWKLIELIIGAF
jgi:hypothetical protein